MARGQLTIHAKLRGVMHGVGHAGDRILDEVAHLKDFANRFPEGVERQIYLSLLNSIQAHAEQLKTTADE